MMKKFLLVLLACSPVFASADIYSALATSGWETKEPKKYKVSAKGYDFRVYEWKRVIGDKACVLVSTEHNQFLHCDK